MSGLTQNRQAVVIAAVFWAVCYGAFWLLLTRGEGLGFGAVFTGIATWLSVHLQLKPWIVRFHHLPGLIFLVIRSVLSGPATLLERLRFQPYR